MTRERFRRFAWGVLALNIAVILWGAYVRASGSGAGCGRSWPTCNGEIVPRSPSAATLIELTHRLTSGLALIAVVVLLVGARRVFERGHPVRRGAAWAMVFMLGEAAIGAGIVLFELVADNESMARALFMAVHLGNTFLLLAALALTAHWAGGAPPLTLRGQPRRSRLAGLSLGCAFLIGVSGAVAALGDTLFPVDSLGEAIQQDLSPTSHLLIQLRISHPLIAIAASLVLLHFIATVRRDPERRAARRFANLLNVLIFVQITAGAVNVVLLAPIWMQLLHLLLADLLWIALVLTCGSFLAEASGPVAGETVARRPAAGAAPTRA